MITQLCGFFHNPSYAQVRFVHLSVFKIHLKKRNRKQILNSKQWKKREREKEGCRKFENKEIEGEKRGCFLVPMIR